MSLTIVVLLGVVMVTCLIGVAVIPRFDRRPPLSSWQPTEKIRAESKQGVLLVHLPKTPEAQPKSIQV